MHLLKLLSVLELFVSVQKSVWLGDFLADGIVDDRPQIA
jgi:hypothetical protein